MNNYCTNCGTKLKSYTVICDKCKTPVADISYEYKHVSLKQRLTKRRITMVVLMVILVIYALFVARKFYISHMSEKLMNEMVIPFLEERYGNYYSDLEFDIFGKCIVDGNCYTEPLFSCDGNGCEVYTYLSRFKCMSFYYTYKIGDEQFDVSVFKDNGQYKVVTGRNIYGYDDKFSDSYVNDYDEEEYIKYKNSFIKEDYYESDYILVDNKFDYKFFYKNKTTIDLSNIYGLTMAAYCDKSDLFIKMKKYNKLYEEIGEIKVQYSEDINKYYVDEELEENVKYIKIYIGEVYE